MQKNKLKKETKNDQSTLETSALELDAGQVKTIVKKDCDNSLTDGADVVLKHFKCTIQNENSQAKYTYKFKNKSKNSNKKVHFRLSQNEMFTYSREEREATFPSSFFENPHDLLAYMEEVIDETYEDSDDGDEDYGYGDVIKFINNEWFNIVGDKDSDDENQYFDEYDETQYFDKNITPDDVDTFGANEESEKEDFTDDLEKDDSKQTDEDGFTQEEDRFGMVVLGGLYIINALGLLVTAARF